MYRNNRYCCCCQCNLINNDNTNNAVESTKQENIPNTCQCGFKMPKNVFPDNPMLGQSYVPMQYMSKTYTPACGLKNGTIFPELVSPYEPGESIDNLEYIASRNTIGRGCNG